MPKKKLTPNQKLFVNEYLIDRNGTRAYKAAYPNIKKDEVATAAASRLLINVKVQEEIQKRVKKCSQRRYSEYETNTLTEKTY